MAAPTLPSSPWQKSPRRRSGAFGAGCCVAARLNTSSIRRFAAPCIRPESAPNGSVRLSPRAARLFQVTTGGSQGSRFGAATGSGGSVQCWGSNEYGQLGTGESASSLQPVTVLGFRPTRSVHARRCRFRGRRRRQKPKAAAVAVAVSRGRSSSRSRCRIRNPTYPSRGDPRTMRYGGCGPAHNGGNPHWLMPHGSTPAWVVSIWAEGNVRTTTPLNKQLHSPEPVKSQVAT